MQINCPKCGEEIKLVNKSAQSKKEKYGPDFFREIAKKSLEARRIKYGEKFGFDKAREKRWVK